MKRIFFIFFLLIGVSLSAQDTLYVIVGKVLDGDTYIKVPGVFLVNVKKLYGVQTDTSGKFRMLMTKNDSIRVSCIGYKTFYWQPDFSLAKNFKIHQNIYLTKEIYQIGAVNIYKLRYYAVTYQALHNRVSEYELQEKLTDWLQKEIAKEHFQNIDPQAGLQIVLPMLSRQQKQQRQIEKYRKLQELNKKANEKFNPEIVSKVTGLQGEELKKFMNYCSFDRDFILETPEYNLLLIIKDIYAEYKTMDKKEKKK